MLAWIPPLGAVPQGGPREQDFAPAEYLRAAEPWALDIALEIEVAGEVLSRPRSSWLYWTPAQMLAHMTVNGAQLSQATCLPPARCPGLSRGRRARSARS